MPRRKSLIAKAYAAYKKNKQRRERERRQAEKDQLAELRRLEKEQERRESKAQREADRAERERRQQDLERQRDERQRELEGLVAEADVRTAAVQSQVQSLNRVLNNRTRNLFAHGLKVDAAFTSGGPDAVASALQSVLTTAAHLDGLATAYAAQYRPEARELLIECELPRQDVVPTVRSYRFVKTKKTIEPEPRKEAEIKTLYERVLASLVLRVLAEAFDASPVTLVTSIVINGYVSAKDRATGKAVRPCLISVNAERDAFSEIVLDEPELNPVLCLREFLNAIVSPHPYDLVGVRPVVQFDLSSYKFISEIDVVAGLDSRLDLLTLTPGEFEHLIRALFEKMGMKSWVTQGSRDDGVDGVAINEDPIVGGLCIIQAKRYSKVVGVEAVHALAGVMNDKAAAKGVLVTTSWVGKTSREFASRNGRIEIIDGRNLKALLKEFLNLDVLIGLPKVPPGWNQHDLT